MRVAELAAWGVPNIRFNTTARHKRIQRPHRKYRSVRDKRIALPAVVRAACLQASPTLALVAETSYCWITTSRTTSPAATRRTIATTTTEAADSMTTTTMS